MMVIESSIGWLTIAPMRIDTMRIALAVTAFMACGILPAADTVPASRVDPVADMLHGTKITDPYRWLEDQDSPQTRAWIDSQNQYTQAYLARIDGREKLRQRLEALRRYDTRSIPVARAGRYFYSRRLKNENRSSICVRTGLNGPDEILVNPAEVSADESTTIGLSDVTQDGKLMAYFVRRGGADELEFRLLDLQSRRLLTDSLPRARYTGFDVKPDRSGIYYSTYSPKDGGGAYYHTMGSDPTTDKQIFGKGYTPRQIIEVSLSEDGRYLLAQVVTGVPASKVEVWLQDLKSGGPFRPIVNDIDAEFRPVVAGGKVYLWTNWKAPNWRLLACDPSDPAREKWREAVPESEWPLERVSYVGGRIFAQYLEDVKTRVKQFDPAGKALGDMKLPGVGSVGGPSGRWDNDEAFFLYTSFLEPGSVHHYSVATGRSDVWFRPQIPVKTEEAEVEQVWYESKDKTRIPMFLVHKKGLARDANRPVLLTGYGGFNISETARFNYVAALWAEMDGVFALPNLRGGGEFGEKWHHAGMFENKQNVFDDFIGAAEWLVKNKYTRPERIAVEGMSNGGLLVGAALVQRPDLFGAVICEFPLLDMLRYQKFKVGSYWITEYGSAEDSKQFPYLLKYSPYHNVEKGAKYPAVMFTTGDADTRVDPLHARKMTALVQASTASGKPVLLDYDTKAGHSGGKPLDKQIQDDANWLGFALAQLGVLPVK